MAWRIVKQPNSKLARFSDVVDNFTDIDMSEEEAVELCMSYDLNLKDAIKKVQAGIDDHTQNINTSDNGLNRWVQSLSIIHRVHGKEEVLKILKRIDI